MIIRKTKAKIFVLFNMVVKREKIEQLTGFTKWLISNILINSTRDLYVIKAILRSASLLHFNECLM